MNFEKKIILITGAARGIGRAIAESFAEEGALIALHYNSNQAAAEQTISSLKNSNHKLFQSDISNAEAAKTLVENVVANFGRIDILVNNAAVYSDHPMMEVSFDEWQAEWNEIINVNLLAAANIMYCAAHQMKQQGGGKIINIGSRGAFRGEPDAPAYGASKAALHALSQSLAVHLAPHNIFVSVVAPGWVATERQANKITDSHRSQSPLNRVATPEEVAKTVLFLASEGTDFLTGSIIDVNGASYLRT
jgi:3-oxoacyl-[acyl-carrier protein] reductase